MPDSAALDLQTASALDLVAALADKRLGALEACDAAIGRIEQGDAAINAVVVRDFERAREQARAADAAIGRGERRPLLGLPMTVKEAFDVAGLPTTWGVPLPVPVVATQDAVMVERLKAAGAVILGKTNVAMSLADWQSANPVYGRTVNPLDATRSAGGSSGGSAAALAAGFVPLEVGSDIAGSIRVPAHFCGVYGHKPSHGLLPVRGHDFPGHPGAPDALSVVGPMARSAADLQLAMSVLAGPDVDDAVACRIELPAPRQPGLSGMRVLLLTEHTLARTSAEMRPALERAAEALSKAGAVVSRTSPLLPDLAAGHAAYVAMLMTYMSRGKPLLPGAPLPLSAPQWLGLLDQRELARRAWRSFFEQFDVLLCPPFGTVAFPHTDEPNWALRTLLIDGAATPYGDQMVWPSIATFPGLPATAAPIGKTPEGLPVGVQVIGPYLEDRTTIAFAGQLVEALAAA